MYLSVGDTQSAIDIYGEKGWADQYTLIFFYFPIFRYMISSLFYLARRFVLESAGSEF